MEPLTDSERLDWLQLIRTERIGPRTFRGLMARFGGAAEVLHALPDLARRSGRGGLKIATRAEAEREVDGLTRLGARLVAEGEPDYPVPLLAIDTAPPLVALRGSPATLTRPGIAIVGSRNASAAGGAFAQRLAAEFGRAGYTVVSGLARGIDARAHLASVETGTVAVLAGGHDRIYPGQHVDLLARILDSGGAAVSEMPLGWEPRGRDFPRRNRIVSGLCYGVVVVEAARRSGSLITARFALDQGREVFAVPGSPLDPRAEGTNDLIRAGATLCGDPEHVLAVLDPLLRQEAGALPTRPAFSERVGEEFWEELDAPLLGLREEEPPGPPDDIRAGTSAGNRAGTPDEQGRERLVATLGPSPVPIDDLVRQTELPAGTVHRLLVELELAGRIDRLPGGTVALRLAVP